MVAAFSKGGNIKESALKRIRSFLDVEFELSMDMMTFSSRQLNIQG